MEKKYCATHHVYHSQTECPYCFNERISKYERYVKPQVEIPIKNEEPTQEDIDMLLAKFNSK